MANQTQPQNIKLFEQKQDTEKQQQSNICRRRGVQLSPLIIPLHINMRKSENATSYLHTEERGSTGLGILIPEGIKWSRSPSTIFTPPAPATYEQRLSRCRAFFSDAPPLMRCLDTEDDREFIPDMLFNTLFSDVQRRSDGESYRGVAQIRSFWDDVREQLRVDDEEFKSCWPEGYPVHPAHHPLSANGSDRDIEQKVYRYTIAVPPQRISATPRCRTRDRGLNDRNGVAIRGKSLP